MSKSISHRSWEMMRNDVYLGSFLTGYILRGYIPPDEKCPSCWEMVGNGTEANR